MPTEVELKIAVSSNQRECLHAWLENHASPLEVRSEVDTYFSPTDGGFMEEEYPFEWLSVRLRGDSARLSYKHFYPERAERHTHCEELEVRIDRPETASQLLVSLGFRIIAIVKKTRRTYLVEDRLEVSLDEVENLGSFIEVEAIQPGWDVKHARSQVEELVRTLGLDPDDADLRGYPFLVWQSGGSVDDP